MVLKKKIVTFVVRGKKLRCWKLLGSKFHEVGKFGTMAKQILFFEIF